MCTGTYPGIQYEIPHSHLNLISKTKYLKLSSIANTSPNIELELELEIYFSSKYRVENLQVLVSYIIYTLFWLL